MKIGKVVLLDVGDEAVVAKISETLLGCNTSAAVGVVAGVARPIGGNKGNFAVIFTVKNKNGPATKGVFNFAVDGANAGTANAAEDTAGLRVTSSNIMIAE